MPKVSKPKRASSSRPSVLLSSMGRFVQIFSNKAPKGNTKSSLRYKAAQQAGFNLHTDADANPDLLKRIDKKDMKIFEKLVEVLPSEDHAVTEETLTSTLFYIDGGVADNPSITPDPRYRYIRKGENNMSTLELIPITVQHVSTLHVPETGKGLRLMNHDKRLVALRVPREDALQWTGLGNTNRGLGQEGSRPLLNAFDDSFKANDMKKKRSSRCAIQCDGRYVCVGSAANRGGKGIVAIHHGVKKMKGKSLDLIHRFIRGVEHLFRMWMPSEAIHQVQEGLNVADVPLFTTPDGKTSKIYQAFACAKNVYLSAHVDRDFTFSAVTVLKEGKYGMDDDEVAYFNFPRLGVSIPLRPGDLLFFDPSEYHMISSRCKDKDEIYCVSFYLKSNLIGGNDNSLPLNKKQKKHLTEEQKQHLKKEKKKRRK